MNYFRYTFLLFFMWANTIFAQQLPYYSQYQLNSFVINPAITGIEDYGDVRMAYRNQWTGFDGEPTTFYLSGHFAIAKPDRTSSLPLRGRNGRLTPLRRMYPNAKQVPGHWGVGMLLLGDRTGPSSRIKANLAVARHFSLSPSLKLSVGVASGVTRHTLDFDQIILSNPTDPAVQQGKVNAYQIDLNAGAWLYSDKFFVGASAQQLLPNSLDFQPTTAYQWLGNTPAHFFLTTGVKLPLNEYWQCIPSIMIKKAGPTPLQFDTNLRFAYNERFWTTFSYRHQDALVASLGFNINYLLNISYAYDYPLSSINTVARTSHEIVLGIMLNNGQRLLCPRQLW